MKVFKIAPLLLSLWIKEQRGALKNSSGLMFGLIAGLIKVF